MLFCHMSILFYSSINMSEIKEPQATEAPTATSGGFGPPPEQIAKAAEAAKAAKSFQDAADALKKQASLATDPVERENLWRAAYVKEKEAHGESRKARIMASGWGQGAGAGIGLSGAVGMGLGNLVGTLLSGVVAIPGSLIGAGVGALHGPWYSLQDMVKGKGNQTEAGNGGKDAEGKPSNETAPEEDPRQEVEAHRAIVEAARRLEEEEEAEKPSKEDVKTNASGDTAA
ncbi:hypothetical protein VM1G_04639 [Cytospora mali]|uniref:Uncharacterized protein n=1 Tax=Cytospora mali TaxID=578113 RepID=A0A194VYQ5_CYTMA|nr:hypothetical protein VM1G_04639 [Valsa mali]